VDIESSLQATEKLLDVKLTIIDNRGTFRTPEGNPLFGPDRHTHQKHRACKAGFCQACIRHCRHDMNHRGELEKRPFVRCMSARCSPESGGIPQALTVPTASIFPSR
jgi:hypothetical protein